MSTYTHTLTYSYTHTHTQTQNQRLFDHQQVTAGALILLDKRSPSVLLREIIGVIVLAIIGAQGSMGGGGGVVMFTATISY